MPLAEKFPAGTGERSEIEGWFGGCYLPGQSWSTYESVEHGSKDFWYTCIPYAVTTRSAVTYCFCVLVPEASKVMLLEDRSKEISTLFTLMVDVPLLQSDTPLVLRISVASTDGSKARQARLIADVLHIFVPFSIYSTLLQYGRQPVTSRFLSANFSLWVPLISTFVDRSREMLDVQDGGLNALKRIPCVEKESNE